MGVEIAATEVEEKKPDRPPSKTPPSGIYPVLNKYSEKTASVKELTTSKISMHKENTVSKESSTHSTITHTSKNETEKLIHNETVNETTLDGQIKKPPVPLKKSPTPSTGVGGLFSGLKNKMLSSNDKEKSSSTTVSSGSSSGGEWDRPDGAASSKAPVANADTFDRVERNSILNDPRASRVKAPRRRPPSQVLRDDTPQHIGLSNGHETESIPAEKPTEKQDTVEEIKPKAREWEKHKAPWMAELKLNQAKKTSFGTEGKSRSVSASSDTPGVGSKAGGGSTDRILECGLEEKRSTHSMEMSKSTSSISSRMTVLESYEETKVRNSLDSKKEVTAAHREDPPSAKPTLHSPTAAGRTLLNMLDEIKKPPAPPPPLASARPHSLPADPPPRQDRHTDKPADKLADRHADKPVDRHADKPVDNHRDSIVSRTSGIFEKTSTLERTEKIEERERVDKPLSTGDRSRTGTLERRAHSFKQDKAERAERERSDGTDALIQQLNSRISNLEKIIEVQNSMFTAAIAELTASLQAEKEARLALHADLRRVLRDPPPAPAPAPASAHV